MHIDCIASSGAPGLQSCVGGCPTVVRLESVQGLGAQATIMKVPVTVLQQVLIELGATKVASLLHCGSTTVLLGLLLDEGTLMRASARPTLINVLILL